jgi:hypothetical protein|tara:strand:- start:61 stop:252 length:192 start_codon:yes stop_codon:yes gene_type:complete
MAQRLTLEQLKTKYEESLDLLNDLVNHVEEDIPKHQGTKHLWNTVDDVKELLYGPTRSYVDQD